MRMFPVFPVLFPVCSHSRPVDSLRSQCSGFPGLTSMDAMPSSLPCIQQPGTLGTVGTGLNRHELGSAHTRNRRGTLGTDRPKADSDGHSLSYQVNILSQIVVRGCRNLSSSPRNLRVTFAAIEPASRSLLPAWADRCRAAARRSRPGIRPLRACNCRPPGGKAQARARTEPRTGRNASPSIRTMLVQPG